VSVGLALFTSELLPYYMPCNVMIDLFVSDVFSFFVPAYLSHWLA